MGKGLFVCIAPVARQQRGRRVAPVAHDMDEARTGQKPGQRHEGGYVERGLLDQQHRRIGGQRHVEQAGQQFGHCPPHVLGLDTEILPVHGAQLAGEILPLHGDRGRQAGIGAAMDTAVRGQHPAQHGQPRARAAAGKDDPASVGIDRCTLRHSPVHAGPVRRHCRSGPAGGRSDRAASGRSSGCRSRRRHGRRWIRERRRGG